MTRNDACSKWRDGGKEAPSSSDSARKSRKLDPVQKVENHATFLTHSNGSILSSFIGERSEPFSRVFNDQPRDIYIGGVRT